MNISQSLLLPAPGLSRSGGAAARALPQGPRPESGRAEDTEIRPIRPVDRLVGPHRGEDRSPARRSQAESERGRAEAEREHDRRIAPERRRTGPETRPQQARLVRAPDAAPAFLAQLIGQQAGQSDSLPALSAHRDAPALGSEAYRRAGGTPPLYAEEPAFFRIAV